MVVALAVAPGRDARAQTETCIPTSTLVRSVEFDGNRAFSADELASRIVTTPMSWLSRVPVFRVFATRQCLDEREFAGDVLRLFYFYRTHGYPFVNVDTVVKRGDRRADVRFVIAEGTPTVIDTLTITGLDSVRDARRVVEDLPIERGGAFDESGVSAARDTIVRRLRNVGYPHADVLRNYSVERNRRSATVELQVITGPLVHIGEVTINLEPVPGGTVHMAPDAVRAILGVQPGDLYVDRDLVAGQRRLFQTEAFRQVRIELDSAPIAGAGDTLARIVVHAAEAERYAVAVGGGWGTLDCVRTQGSLTDYNFFGGARRLDVNARLSRIGVGALAFGSSAEHLCYPDAHDDQFGDLLNYYVGVTFRQPVLFGFRTVPAVTVYSEQRWEYNSYRRTTPIGLSLTLSPVVALGVPLTFGYSLEYGQTKASPAFFCAQSQLCDPSDRANAERPKVTAVFSVSAVSDWGDSPLNVGRGASLRVEYRHASPTIGSDPQIRFNKVITDASAFIDIGWAGRLAVRLRLGALFDTRGFDLGTEGQFVPIQERLFAGGPNTVRGYRQNQLGPAVYIVQRYDSVFVGPAAGDSVYRARQGDASETVVPIGGNTMVVANLEYRVRSPWLGRLLQFSAFADVGSVWNRNSDSTLLRTDALRWTPGVGIRFVTGIGTIRFDVAYNGYRRDASQAYYDTPLGANGTGGQLYCVSPGNTIIADKAHPVACPATYQPPTPGGFLSRLVPSISIGEAF